jgi:hypothetical protein
MILLINKVSTMFDYENTTGSCTRPSPERLEYKGNKPFIQPEAILPYSTLESRETTNRSVVFYKSLEYFFLYSQNFPELGVIIGG